MLSTIYSGLVDISLPTAGSAFYVTQHGLPTTYSFLNRAAILLEEDEEDLLSECWDSDESSTIITDGFLPSFQTAPAGWLRLSQPVKASRLPRLVTRRSPDTTVVAQADDQLPALKLVRPKRVGDLRMRFRKDEISPTPRALSPSPSPSRPSLSALAPSASPSRELSPSPSPAHAFSSEPARPHGVPDYASYLRQFGAWIQFVKDDDREAKFIWWRKTTPTGETSMLFCYPLGNVMHWGAEPDYESAMAQYRRLEAEL